MSVCKSGQQGTLCIQKYRCDYVLPPLLSPGHLAMNADLLAVLLPKRHHRVCLPLLWASYPSRSVSPSATSAQTIRSFTVIAPWSGSPSPLSAWSPPLPNVVHPHRLPPPSGPEQLQPTFRSVLRLRASALCSRMTPNIFKLHLSFHKTPWATASLSEKVVQYMDK